MSEERLTVMSAESLAHTMVLASFFEVLARRSPEMRAVVFESLENAASLVEMATFKFAQTGNALAPSLPYSLSVIDHIRTMADGGEHKPKDGV